MFAHRVCSVRRLQRRIELPHLETFPEAACCQPTELPGYKAAPLQAFGPLNPPRLPQVDPVALSWDDIAMRTIVDLPDEQIRALDAYSKKHGVSRAEAVRRAIARFLPQRPHRKLDLSGHPAFGSWERRNVDSIEFQRKLRAEWGKRS
jgi:hypothetical protein